MANSCKLEFGGPEGDLSRVDQIYLLLDRMPPNKKRQWIVMECLAEHLFLKFARHVRLKLFCHIQGPFL